MVILPIYTPAKVVPLNRGYEGSQSLSVLGGSTGWHLSNLKSAHRVEYELLYSFT